MGVRKEAKSLLRQGFLMTKAAARQRVAPTRQETEASHIVVFVHGFMAGRGVFEPLGRRLRAKQPSIEQHTFAYRARQSFADIALDFSSFLSELPEHAEVSLVGHSLGGVICRHHVLHGKEVRPIVRLVTIASPHRGTRLANLFPSKLARAMRPGSEVLESLSTPMTLPHLAIVAGRDAMVLPPSSAALPSASVKWLHDVGHNEILFDARMHDWVVEALSAPSSS